MNLANAKQFAKDLPIQIYILKNCRYIVNYQKIHQAKMHVMSILKYFRTLREKPDLPDPSGPLRETVQPTAIVAVNVKVNEALNDGSRIEEKCKQGP